MKFRFAILTESRLNENEILSEIKLERNRQNLKWGFQSHSIAGWMMILGEEYGESCKSANESYYRDYPLKLLRKELIETCAVSLAIIEAIDSFGE